MHLLRATFDRDRAYEKISELLALEDHPERLAEKLSLPRDVEKIKAGIAVTSYARLLKEVEKLREFVALEKEIEEVQSGKWTFSFMGKGFAEKKIATLMDKRRKFGSLIETPRWFFRQERVWLLNVLRDYALDSSNQGDAEWVENPLDTFTMPVSHMLETGDLDAAKVMVAELGKPFKDVDPAFVMTRLEGHRTLYFDVDKRHAYYYVALKGY